MNKLMPMKLVRMFDLIEFSVCDVLYTVGISVGGEQGLLPHLRTFFVGGGLSYSWKRGLPPEGNVGCGPCPA